MSRSTFAFVYFVYGLAFFCMGIVVLVERDRGSDKRLRHALRPLAAFGILHGIHEWLEMFQILGVLPGQETSEIFWEGLRASPLGLFLPVSGCLWRFPSFTNRTNPAISACCCLWP